MIFEAGKGWLLSAMFQVRKEEGAELLRGLGAKHVVVTSREAFPIFFAKFNFFSFIGNFGVKASATIFSSHIRDRCTYREGFKI